MANYTLKHTLTLQDFVALLCYRASVVERCPLGGGRLPFLLTLATPRTGTRSTLRLLLFTFP